MLRRLYTNHFAVGNTTRNGDGAKDWGHSDPIRNGDAFETLVTVTPLSDEKDTPISVVPFSAREITMN